jgi:hypothetical protein
VTRPGEGDPADAKRHLKSFRKRLDRRFGRFGGFWRMCIQQRGAIHFHLILFVPPSFAVLKELRRSASSAWYEVCGEVSHSHLRAGANVEAVRKWQGFLSRAERYAAREEEFPEGLRTGRVWGVWNDEFLLVAWETVELSPGRSSYQAGLPKASQKEGHRFSAYNYGLRAPRERLQGAGVPGIQL